MGLDAGVKGLWLCMIIRSLRKGKLCFLTWGRFEVVSHIAGGFRAASP